jgi:hypothetical protein
LYEGISGGGEGVSPGVAEVTGGVNHASEHWQKVSFDCGDQVSELVGLTGIQHNQVIGGLTSGGLQFNKDVEGDFLVCSQTQGTVDVGTTKVDKKVKSITLQFDNSDFGIVQPRVDMLSPANRAPLRAGDSLATIQQKEAACDTLDSDSNPNNNCDDTGTKIDWPKIYQGKLLGKWGPHVTVPGPRIAVNPDNNVRLPNVAGQTAQLAISLDGTTIQHWDAAVTNIEKSVEAGYLIRYAGTGVKVNMIPAVLPAETEVIAQRMAAISPDLTGLFVSADFQAGPNNQGTELEVKAPNQTELNVTMSDVAPTPQTLAALNTDLAKYNIGATPAGITS